MGGGGGIHRQLLNFISLFEMLYCGPNIDTFFLEDRTLSKLSSLYLT